MRIVHCFFSFTYGGAEVLAVNLLNEMCKDHPVSLVIINNLWSEELLGELDERVAVYRLGRRPGSRNPLPLIRFNRLLSRLRPDIIHSHDDSVIDCIWWGKYKTLLTVHDLRLKNTSIARYDKVVAVSAVVQQEIQNRFHIDATVIHNGIDAGRFVKRTTYRIADKEPLKIVQVARLVHEKKGQDIMLQALHELVTVYKKNVQLDFIGEGPSLAHLQELTRTLHLEKHVQFLGSQSRQWLYKNLAGYHILAQPSRYEGFGIAALEGLAAGLPILASSPYGTAQILSQPASDYIFRGNSFENCVSSVKTILSHYLDDVKSNCFKKIATSQKAFFITQFVTSYMTTYIEIV